MRLAIAHDYLIQMGGAERVVATMSDAYPEAPIYTSVTDYNRLLPELRRRDIHNSWAQRVPTIRQQFKTLFPIYPFAFRSFSPVDADVLWISSSGFSKWIRTSPTTPTICYCHTPPRFFWESDIYLDFEVHRPTVRESAKRLLGVLRNWDFKCAQKIGRFIANSRCVQERINRFYGRSSTIIYPPVNVDRFEPFAKSAGYYLILSRLVGYKRIDLAVRAFNQLKERLVIIGQGPDRARLEALAGPTISFLGQVGEAEATQYLQECRGLIFPGLEDFGIVALEAQACGRPVIAFAGGGALETVIDGETGILFPERSPESLATAVRRSQQVTWCPQTIRANAERFSREVFLERMTAVLKAVSRSEPQPAGKISEETALSLG
jgi:glycosyltransferase involved in cell wall biosynthesis